jgi:hypothetical protein
MYLAGRPSLLIVSEEVHSPAPIILNTIALEI